MGSAFSSKVRRLNGDLESAANKMLNVAEVTMHAGFLVARGEQVVKAAKAFLADENQSAETHDALVEAIRVYEDIERQAIAAVKESA